MTHYHVMFGPDGGPVLADAIYDNGDESIVNFVTFAKELYGHRYNDVEHLTFDDVRQKVLEDDTLGAYIGTATMIIVWKPCEDCRGTGHIALLN